MNNVLLALTGKFGLALCYTQWRALIAILAPIFRLTLERFLARLVPSDKEWIMALFNHRAWRIVRALCVAILGIQLPSAEVLQSVIIERKIKAGDANIASKI